MNLTNSINDKAFSRACKTMLVCISKLKIPKHVTNLQYYIFFSCISNLNLGIEKYKHVSLKNIKYRIDFIVYSNCGTIGLLNPLKKKNNFLYLKNTIFVLIAVTKVCNH